ncbi:MAG: twin-arginine translocase subunit TatC, partial [Chloroflexi bacterium]|nr:twin-arginine translocase subunit TatC [Chloroflexota bacterium]
MDADRPAQPPQEPEEESQDSQAELGGVMTLREHLQELRTRLTIAVLAVIVASLIVWPFKDFVFEVVQYPLPRGAILQQISPTETLFTFFMISIIV